MSDKGVDERGTPGPVRVLLVDDHRMVVDGLAAVIDDTPDIEIVGTVGTLQAALALAATADVVVMDYRLPDGDGAAGVRSIRALDGAPQVVMLTASGEDRVLREALQAGCCGFVTKGSSVELLLEAIRAARTGDSVFSPDVVRRLARAQRGAGATIDPLSAREVEVLSAIARSESTAQIAESMVLSEHTVRNHVRNVLTKLGAHTKLEAVVIAARAGLIDLGEPR